MQNLILIPVEDLRQIIREELINNKPDKIEPKVSVKPISQKELCSFLGLSEPTVIRWRSKGRIPYIQIGPSIRYNLDDVIKSLEVSKSKSF